jgi:hypothetical protein
MADYGSIPAIKAMLGLSEYDEDNRLDDLNAVVSRQMEDKAGLAAGATYGTAGEDVSRTFIPATWTDTLSLGIPLSTVTTVTEDGVELERGVDYELVYQQGPFYGGIYRMGDPFGWAAVNRDPVPGLGWWGTIVVTGIWADQAGEPIDPIIVEAANVLVAGYWRKDQTADGDVGGSSSEGETFVQGDPWKDPRVKAFLDRYAAWQG